MRLLAASASQHTCRASLLQLQWLCVLASAITLEDSGTRWSVLFSTAPVHSKLHASELKPSVGGHRGDRAPRPQTAAKITASELLLEASHGLAVQALRNSGQEASGSSGSEGGTEHRTPGFVYSDKKAKKPKRADAFGVGWFVDMMNEFGVNFVPLCCRC